MNHAINLIAKQPSMLIMRKINSCNYYENMFIMLLMINTNPH